MKKQISIIIIIVIIVSLGALYAVLPQGSIVLTCNGLRFSKEMYNIYLITEAVKMDYSEFASSDDYWAELRRNVRDRISLDSHYYARVRDKRITLNEQESIEANAFFMSEISRLGFDISDMSDNAFREYFNVSQRAMREFFVRRYLFEKYVYIVTSSPTDILSPRHIRRMPMLADRVHALNRYNEFRREQGILSREVDRRFDERRWYYASCNIELIVMSSPNIEIANQIMEDISRNSEEYYYFHQIPEKYEDYVDKAVFITGIDRFSNMKDIFGEDFVRQCLNANNGEIFKVVLADSILIVRMVGLFGRNENRANIEREIRREQMAHTVRKALLDERYEPQVVNWGLYNSFYPPRGRVWQNLLSFERNGG